ncbi:hypothetical protein DFH06DRAFT_1066691 [Mycena polygramma]|nr:hypothetical protein DFH06DRAFT_1066691 [Mycena polygramma]
MDGSDGISSESQEHGLIRVEDLWFNDHGLVVQAGNRLFRVSSATLAARSSVFRDMLSIPQPESQPLIDGCPVVLLHDSPIDAEHFLKAIFDSGFFERPPAPTTFQIVSGVLKLSTKYDVEYLRRRALLHLSTALPRSLEEFDSRIPHGPFGSRACIFPLLVLVHDLALTWALPIALFLASCSAVEDIVDGILFEDTCVKLPHILQRTVLVARCTLAIERAHESFRFLRYLPCEGCLSPTSCRHQSRAVLDALVPLPPNAAISPLETMDPWWPTFRFRFCAPCFLVAETEHRTSRQKIWNTMPAIFGPDTWETLDEARSAALE